MGKCMHVGVIFAGVGRCNCLSVVAVNKACDTGVSVGMLLSALPTLAGEVVVTFDMDTTVVKVAEI